jgi:hypothetical protein
MKHAPGLTHISRHEMPARCIHSSLSRTLINYGRNKFYNIGLDGTSASKRSKSDLLCIASNHLLKLSKTDFSNAKLVQKNILENLTQSSLFMDMKAEQLNIKVIDKLEKELKIVQLEQTIQLNLNWCQDCKTLFSSSQTGK